MKIIVLLLLAAIVASLMSGLYFLTRDRQGSERMLMALKVRVGLSIALILFLVMAFWFGLIGPDGR